MKLLIIILSLVILNSCNNLASFKAEDFQIQNWVKTARNPQVNNSSLSGFSRETKTRIYILDYKYVVYSDGKPGSHKQVEYWIEKSDLTYKEIDILRKL